MIFNDNKTFRHKKLKRVIKQSGQNLTNFFEKVKILNSNKMVTSDIVDCATKTCELSQQTNIDPCLVFLQNDNANCSIPCNVQFCDSELRYGAEYCDLWICTPKVTPTPIPIPPSPSPPNPFPPNPIPDTTIGFYISLLINLILVIVFCFLVAFLFRQMRLISLMRTRLEDVFGMRPQDVEAALSSHAETGGSNPIVRYSTRQVEDPRENQPLLGATRSSYQTNDDDQETSFIHHVRRPQHQTQRLQMIDVPTPPTQPMTTFSRSGDTFPVAIARYDSTKLK